MTTNSFFRFASICTHIELNISISICVHIDIKHMDIRPKLHTWNIKDTVDKLDKSKLTGNVNVNKMVLPLISCW